MAEPNYWANLTPVEEPVVETASPVSVQTEPVDYWKNLPPVETPQKTVQPEPQVDYWKNLPQPETPQPSPQAISIRESQGRPLAEHQPKDRIKRTRTQLSPEEEKRFRQFYSEQATKIGLNPNPDDPLHKYDYRGAWKAGYGPTEESGFHWPSKFKDDDHPNRFVNGVDTKYQNEHLPPPTPMKPPTTLNPPIGDAGAVSSKQDISAWKALAVPLAESILPTTAGITSGGQAVKGIDLALKAASKTPLPWWGKLAVGLGVGFGGSYATEKLQSMAQEKLIGEQAYKDLEKWKAQAREEHPVATAIGQIAPGMVFFRPSWKDATSIGAMFRGMGREGLKIAAEKNPEAVQALINGAFGAGTQTAIEAFQQVQSGDFQPVRLAIMAISGGLSTKPTKLGQAVTGGGEVAPRTPIEPTGEAPITPPPIPPESVSLGEGVAAETRPGQLNIGEEGKLTPTTPTVPPTAVEQPIPPPPVVEAGGRPIEPVLPPESAGMGGKTPSESTVMTPLEVMRLRDEQAARGGQPTPLEQLTTDLEAKTYQELRKQAKEAGVDVQKVTKRNELIKAIEENKTTTEAEIPTEPSPANDSAESPIAPRLGRESKVSLGKKTAKEETTPTEVAGRLVTKSPSLTRDVLDAYAKSEVAKNPTKAKERAMSDELSPEAFTIAKVLRDKARTEKDFDAEVEITNRIAEKAKIGGQASNFIKLWYNGLSPDGFTAMVKKDAVRNGYNLTDEQAKFVKESKLKIDAIPEGDAKDLARQDLIKKIVDMTPRRVSFLNGLMMFRLNNALSSPRSTLRNSYSNSLQALVTRPASLVGEGIAYKDKKAVGDAFKWWGDMNGVMGDAIQNYKKAMRDIDVGKWSDSEEAMTAISAERQARVPKSMTWFLRFMNAQDKFFSTFIEQGEKVRLMRNGVPEAQAVAQAKALSEKYLFRESLKSPQGKDVEAKAASTLRHLGLAFEQINKVPLVGPLAKHMILFIRTPTNVAKFMVESSPMGVTGRKDYSKLSPMDAYLHKEQVGRAVMGSIITGVGGLWALNGNTAWMPPQDPKAKEQWYATGRKPFSIRIGDSWVPMWYLGPYALPFAIPAAIADQWRDNPNKMSKTTAEKLQGLAYGTLRFIGSQTSTAGAANVLEMLEGRDPRMSAKALGFASTQYIPFSGLVRYINTIIDPYFRKSKGFIDTVKKDLPLLSNDLDKYMTPDRQPAMRTLSDWVAPYTIGTAQDSKESQLQRRQSELGRRQLELKKKQERKR